MPRGQNGHQSIRKKVHNIRNILLKTVLIVQHFRAIFMYSIETDLHWVFLMNFKNVTHYLFNNFAPPVDEHFVIVLTVTQSCVNINEDLMLIY